MRLWEMVRDDYVDAIRAARDAELVARTIGARAKAEEAKVRREMLERRLEELEHVARLEGFFAGLTDEQKASAKAYRGPENFGEADAPRAQSCAPPTRST